MTYEFRSSFGGAGYQPRLKSSVAEIAANAFGKTQIGVASEWMPLRHVTLADPSSIDFPRENAAAYLMRRPVNENELRTQFEGLKALYGELGVEVSVVYARGPFDRCPNFLFQRDLFNATQFGAVMARMGARQRAIEEIHCQVALADLAIPIFGTVVKKATFEGADLLWLRPGVGLLGVGTRTNIDAAYQLTNLFRPFGVSIMTIDLPSQVQHLLGAVNFLDRDLAAVRADACNNKLRGVLKMHGIKTLEFEPVEEITERLAMNFVTIGPRKIVMPSGCDRTRAAFESESVEVYETDISEYAAAEGGMACATGVVSRAPDIEGEFDSR